MLQLDFFNYFTQFGYFYLFFVVLYFFLVLCVLPAVISQFKLSRKGNFLVLSLFSLVFFILSFFLVKILINIFIVLNSVLCVPVILFQEKFVGLLGMGGGRIDYRFEGAFLFDSPSNKSVFDQFSYLLNFIKIFGWDFLLNNALRPNYLELPSGQVISYLLFCELFEIKLAEANGQVFTTFFFLLNPDAQVVLYEISSNFSHSHPFYSFFPTKVDFFFNEEDFSACLKVVDNRWKSGSGYCCPSKFLLEKNCEEFERIFLEDSVEKIRKMFELKEKE